MSYYDEKTGKLTSDGNTKIIRWIEDKGLRPCLACSSHKGWNISNTVGYLPVIGGKELTPVIILVCDGCGSINSRSAIVIGIAENRSDSTPAVASTDSGAAPEGS